MSYGQPYASPNAPPKPQGGGGGVILVVIIVVVALLVLTLIGCIIGMAALLLPAVGAARNAARQAQSRNNLFQIGIALHEYHDTYGTLPPAMLPAQDGQPGKSWRTMILPFVEQTPLHDRYDNSSAWNSPSNKFVRETRLKAYESAAAGESTPGKTNYVVVVGPNTAFAPDKKMTFVSMPDGTSNTILVLEIANSDIEWSEPRDLDINNLVFAKTAPPGAKNVVVAGTQVLLGDASIRRLPRELTLEQLKVLLDPADGMVQPQLD